MARAKTQKNNETVENVNTNAEGAESKTVPESGEGPNQCIARKRDFMLLVSVKNANPNGDPMAANRPRTDYNGYGEMSAECIKRKIRNRMQDMGHTIFVQSEDHKGFDGQKTLEKRAEAFKKELLSENRKAQACKKWLDVRTFGQVFTLGEKTSFGVRGPVSIHQAVSVSPVDIFSMQITKCVPFKNESDTMGMKHIVRYGLYTIKGSISVQCAQDTGFTNRDAEVVKECLRTLFENDVSSARPDGSMHIEKFYWWEHEQGCRASTYTVHNSVKIKLKDDVNEPKSFDDYKVEIDKIDGVNLDETIVID